MDKTVLVTAFSPFGHHADNPTMDIAKALVGVHHCVLPVVRGECVEVLAEHVQQVQPDVVIALGLAANRNCISLERIAVNIDDFPIADNSGQQAIDQPVVEHGPLAYASTLPVKAILQAWQQQGIAAQLSYSAGTFVCNHLFYAMQHRLADMNVMSGFIHTPSLSAMALAEQCRAIATAIDVATHTSTDAKVTAGRVS